MSFIGLKIIYLPLTEMWFSMIKISWNTLKFTNEKKKKNALYYCFVQGRISWKQEISGKILKTHISARIIARWFLGEREDKFTEQASKQ